MRRADLYGEGARVGVVRVWKKEEEKEQGDDARIEEGF